MKIIIVCILLLGFYARALPLETWKKSVVKISSYPCLTGAPRFQGSGILIKKEGVTYVVTSEHVLLQSFSPDYCHEADGISLKLVKVDFYSGLGLLKSDSHELLGRAVSWEILKEQKPGMALYALGYPSGSMDLSVLKDGKELSNESRRALIAGVPLMIEAANLPVEYGMSGGILLRSSGNDYSFAGLISHQVLKRIAGQPTKPGDLAPGETGLNDLALSIPANFVFTWVEQRKDPQSSIWTRNATSQIEKRDSIQYGPLQFSLKNKIAKDVWDDQVGGGDGAGVGGGDGAGVGGDGHTNENGEEILTTVEVSFLPGASVTEKTTSLNHAEIDKWKNWLLAGRKVNIVFLKSQENQRMGRLQSLSQFLTYWLRDGMIPVAVRSRTDQNSDIEELVKVAREVSKQAQVGRDSSTTELDRSWFSMIRNASISAENGLASSGNIESLLSGENDRFWRQYYEKDFDSAVLLESQIQRLIAQMKKMGL